MLTPITHCEIISDQLEFSLKTRMGALILAGGQASRLGIDFPKGAVPVTLIKQKSLFQIFLEKAKAAAERESFPLPVAIMTSPLNHHQTVQFLREHHFFGFPEKQLFFFTQSMRPLEDLEGNLLDLMGPDGNGGALKQFYAAGIWHQWRQLGVEAVSLIPVDNALADPFDAKIIFKGEDLILKAILRASSEEKVGVLVQDEGQIKVIEYNELPSHVKETRCEDGSLLFPLANSGLLCFSMDFIAKEQGRELPLHRQKKRIKWKGQFKEVYKYETFIFDLIPYASRIKVVLYPRERTFAPLKNNLGEDSLITVQKALLESDYHTFFNIFQKKAGEDNIFELDPRFYYPTQALVNQWRERALPLEAYIEA